MPPKRRKSRRTMKEMHRVQQEERRSEMSQEEVETNRQNNREGMDRARSQRTEEGTDAERQANRESMRNSRKRSSTDSLDAESEANRGRMEHSRIEERQNLPTRYLARSSTTFASLPLEPSHFGSLTDENSTYVCPYCNAVKFKKHKNRHSSCCNKGKVSVPVFPNHPEVFRALWEPKNPRYPIVKKHARALNNCLAMASLQAKSAPVPGKGYTPSVVIQGKVHSRMGPLIPNAGEPPVFAQLYVLDPAMDEGEIRFGNMSLCASTTETEKNVLRSVLRELQEALRVCNDYVKDFRSAAEIAREVGAQTVSIKIDDTKRPSGEHATKFNRSFKEISVLTDDQEATRGQDRSFVVKCKDGTLQTIRDTHRSADPLHFPLLFPQGSDGWHLDLQRSDGKRLTALEFYTYQLQYRRSQGAPLFHNPILRTGKLYQEYLCIAQAKVENQRLRFMAHNQRELRGSSYKRICEDVAAHKNNDNGASLKSGTPVILPASFTGSPRYFAAHFHDAMAICRCFHKPDIFLTFTCNTQWEEILRSLEPGQRPEDRPDIVAKVFHLKLQKLKEYLFEDAYFGRVDAHLGVIEFQKRGLPHAHILIILKNEDRIRTAQDADEVTSAEIPDPSKYKDENEKRRVQKLQDIILNCNIHTCSDRCRDHNSCPKNSASVQDAIQKMKPELAAVSKPPNDSTSAVRTQKLSYSAAPSHPVTSCSNTLVSKPPNVSTSAVRTQKLSYSAAPSHPVTSCSNPLVSKPPNVSTSAVRTQKLSYSAAPSHPVTSRSNPFIPSEPTATLKLPSKCSKGFPKDFCSKTEWDDNAFYPLYKRTCPEDGGLRIVRGTKVIDNRSVVPYNPALSFLLEAHINVELCVSPTAAKYLFKYTLKGQDRAMASVGYDEVEEYLNFRSIGSSSAVWRLEKFDLTFRYPAVVALRIHLPGENYVVYEEGSEDEVAARGQKTTELDGFFAFNAANPDTEVKYVDFPREFVLKNKRNWQHRKRGRFGGTIGRIHTVHPIQSPETFYLRILLHHDHCKGKTSFEDLRTLDGVLCETYKETCQKLHLLKDDAEWHEALQEAGFMMFPKQVRSLFVAIVLFSEPSSPRKLFFDNNEEMSDDFKRKFPNATEDQLMALILRDIEEQLEYAGKNLATFGLPPVFPQLIDQVHKDHDAATSTAEARVPVILQEELSFDLEATAAIASARVGELTQSQRRVYDEVMKHVTETKPLALFIDARGGTGKTFTLNTILASARTMKSEKHIALAVASSGIAAILLSRGRTAHSRFKIPINADKDPNASFKISPTDQLAQVIRDAKVIVWDEAPMAHRYLIEGLDRMLRDILRVQLPFGGKVVVFSGDFRQTLPVVVRGNRGRIVDSSLKKSALWKRLKTMRLTENMRVANAKTNQDVLGLFDDFLLSIGDGSALIAEHPDSIALPPSMIYHINADNSAAYKSSVLGFVDIIFPQLHSFLQGDQPGGLETLIDFLSERAILAPKNQMVDNINFIISDLIPTVPVRRYLSADCAVETEDMLKYPIEYLNSLTPSGLPPHVLELKPGMILMLMRNMNPREGMCNGTRLILCRPMINCLECRIATGHFKGNVVFIPRIELWQTDDTFPFQWKRRQFPVRPAFAMTINKSQGQTLSKVGIWLEDPVFTHGQLYVAMSRVGSPENVKVALKKNANGLTRNVVYREVLK